MSCVNRFLMKKIKILFLLIIFLYCKPELINCGEFTIEIDDVECFYQHFDTGEKFDFEYQVITGDFHDFDVIVRYDAPGNKIFHSNKKEFESFVWIVDRTGLYSICFYPRYYRRIYFSLDLSNRVHDTFMEDNLQRGTFNSSALSNVEASIFRLHTTLNLISDFQTHYRLKESQGRLFAEYLLHKVVMRSLLETIILITTGVLQIYIVKKFFV